MLLLLGVIIVFLVINTCGGKRHAYEFGLAEKAPGAPADAGAAETPRTGDHNAQSAPR